METQIDIALVVPEQKIMTKDLEIPLGLLYLGASLKKAGYVPVVYDLMTGKMSEEELLSKLEGIKIVGLSFGTDNRFDGFALCDKIKEKFPSITLIVGGWHVNSAPLDTMENIKSIDIISLNEGEITIVELVKAIKNGITIQNVKGIYYRDDGEIVSTGARPFIKDLDDLPFPDRSLINFKDYNQKLPHKNNIPSTSIMTSRGCPYKCVYCSTARHWGHMTRFRSVKNVVDEIEHLVNDYGFQGIEFRDDTFTLSKKRVHEICNEILKRKLDIVWWCETRANTLDEETIILMKRAGCYYMAMAIESANQKTLEVIRKAITVKQALTVVKLMNKHGLKLKVFFMFGLPGEDKEDVRRTAFLIRELQHKYKVKPIYSITVILPATQLESMAYEKKILPEGFSWSRKECVCNPSQKYNLFFSKFTPLYNEMSYDVLAECVRDSFIAYYLRHPIYFIKDLYEFRKYAFAWIKK